MNRPLFLAAICLLWAFGDVAIATDREKSTRFYEEALEFYREGSFSETTIQLRNALQQDPNNLPARIMLGRVLLLQHEQRAAIKELEKAQAMGGDENLILVPLASAYLEVAEPEHVITGFVARGHNPEVDGELQLLQAEASLQIGDKKRAEELFLAAGTLLPVDPRPILGRARLHMSRGKRDKALKLVNEAITLAPDSFSGWLFKAIYHRDYQEFKSAAEAFEKALEINPTSGRALTARAAMWMDLGQTDKAKDDLRQVENLRSDTLETIYLRTLLMFREGKSEEARQMLRDSSDQIRQIKEEFQSKLPNTKLMLGVVAFFERNYSEAITHLKTFLNAFPNHLGAKRYLASAYLAVGDFKQVIRIYKPSVRTPLPRDPMALSILAEAYRAIGDFKTAEQYFEVALQLAPNVAGIGVRLASSRLDAGRPEAAIAELERLTKRFPDLEEAWFQLVRVHTKSGDIEAAIVSIRTMLEKFGDNPLVQNLAGSTFLAAGDTENAATHLRLAAEMDDSLLLPRLNLARLARMRNEMASAEALYRATLERFPQSAVANVELAQLLAQSGDTFEAMQRATDVLRTDPLYFEAHELKLELLKAKEGNDDRVRTAVYELVQAFPDDPRAELVGGKTYRHLGSLEDARVHFRRAVEKAEFETSMLYKIANQQFGISDFNGALWTLTKAEQGNPGRLGVGVLRAATLTELGEHARALEVINALKEKHGDKPEIYTVEGDLLIAQRQLADAAEAFRKAHDLAPVFQTAQTYFRALVAANMVDEANTFIQGWIKKNPRHLGAKHLHAQLLMKEDNFSAAQKVYEELQAAGIEDVILLNNLAAAYQHQNDPRALPTAEAAYNKAPNDPRVADTYGWILTENGQIEEGLAMLRDAFARASTSPEIRYHIGLALERLGRTKEAREEVEAALDGNVQFSAREEATSLLDRLRKAIQ